MQWVPLGDCQTRIQYKSQEAGGFMKAAGVGSQDRAVGCSLHPLSKSINNKKYNNTCIYSVPTSLLPQPPLEGGSVIISILQIR